MTGSRGHVPEVITSMSSTSSTSSMKTRALNAIRGSRGVSICPEKSYHPPPMDRIPMLVATRGPLAGKRYPVSSDGLVLGRADSCDVPIPDQGVSREHARVLLHNAAVWVQDSGSRNGVYVNGKRVSRHKQLSPGAELTIGVHAFTLELAAELAGSMDAKEESPGPPPPPRRRSLHVGEPTIDEEALDPEVTVSSPPASVEESTRPRGVALWAVVLGAFVLAGLVVGVMWGGPS